MHFKLIIRYVSTKVFDRMHECININKNVAVLIIFKDHNKFLAQFLDTPSLDKDRLNLLLDDICNVLNLPRYHNLLNNSPFCTS